MKCLVLHSGGLDSTVCLLLAKQQGHDVFSLGIDYGQHHKVELSYAAQQCQKFSIERRVAQIKWDKPIRQLPTNRTLEQIKAQPSVAFLPGRNLVFLSLACAEASGVGADQVWLGINAVDYSGYPDCTSEFFAAFKTVASIGVSKRLAIEAPLITLSKPEIARLAISLGLGRGDTWSCYRPQIHGKDPPRPCLRCDACILHEYAWNEANKAS